MREEKICNTPFSSDLERIDWWLEEEPDENKDLLYHDSSFSTSYIREGLDMDELHALGVLFEGKRVQVRIDITMI